MYIKRISAYLLIAAIFLCPNPAFALTSGSVTLDFTFEGAMPDLIQFYPNLNVSDNPGSSLSSTSTSLTNGNSTVSAMLGGPVIYWKTQYNQNPSDYKIGTTSFSLTAQVPTGLSSTSAQADIGGYFLYGGYLPQWGMGYGPDILTLPAFSYTYNFNGQADNTDDRMTFFVQIEIYNFINSESSHPTTYLYSDYEPSAPGFRTKMPFFTYPGSGSTISETDTVSFGPYTESVPHTWAIRFDVSGYVADFATGTPIGGPSTVPEPATMLLLCFGILGLAGARRFRK